MRRIPCYSLLNRESRGAVARALPISLFFPGEQGTARPAPGLRVPGSPTNRESRGAGPGPAVGRARGRARVMQKRDHGPGSLLYRAISSLCRAISSLCRTISSLCRALPSRSAPAPPRATGKLWKPRLWGRASGVAPLGSDRKGQGGSPDGFLAAPLQPARQTQRPAQRQRWRVNSLIRV